MENFLNMTSQSRYPPFGLKGEIYNKAVEGDWFNRFPEKTRQGTILAIQHLLSITKRMGVIAVQDSILFSPGAEHKLRQEFNKKRRCSLGNSNAK